MRDWNKTYEQEGEIQTEVSNFVVDFVNVLKKRKAKKVLDLCFGTGRHTIYLAEQGFEVYGIDISEKGKEITENKARSKPLKLHLQIADMHNLPYHNNFFDAIIAIYAIEHNTIKGLKKTISELYRVLKPGGIMLTNLLSNKDPRYGKGEKIEENTFHQILDPHEDEVTHHFSDKKEAKQLFSKFHLIQLKEKKGFSKRRQTIAFHWEIIAEKQ